MITCGLCGSGVTAQEKYKKQKNGNVHRYIYYGCTRAKDLNCKCGYLREDALIESLINLIDKIDLNELGLKNKFHDEVMRYNRFQRNVLKRPGNEKSESDIDLRVYAKYILKEGSMVEKRELLSCLRSRLIFKDKALTLEKAENIDSRTA